MICAAQSVRVDRFAFVNGFELKDLGLSLFLADSTAAKCANTSSGGQGLIDGTTPRTSPFLLCHLMGPFYLTVTNSSTLNRLDQSQCLHPKPFSRINPNFIHQCASFSPKTGA